MRNVLCLIILVVFVLTVFQKGVVLTWSDPVLTSSTVPAQECLCVGADGAELAYQKMIIKGDCEGQERLHYLSLLKYDFLNASPSLPALVFLSDYGFPENTVVLSAIRSLPEHVPKFAIS